MGDPTAKNATFNDMQLPRAKVIRYLERVLSKMLKEVSPAADVVTRMEIAEPAAIPHYRLGRPDGECLWVMDGRRHKPLTDDEIAERRITWSTSTMTYMEISNFNMSLVSEALDELIASRPSA